jgi:hypothetical protein
MNFLLNWFSKPNLELNSTESGFDPTNWKQVGFYGLDFFPKNNNKSLADPLPDNSDPIDQNLIEVLTGGYKVKITKGIKKMTIFRFLLAKLVYSEKDPGLHLDEFLCLFEIYYNLMDSKDPAFQQKFGLWFERTKPFFEEIARAQEFPVNLKKSLETEKLYQGFLQPVIPTKNAYFGLKGNREIRKSFSLVLNTSIIPKKPKPKSVIGVGYRDKGYRRDVAFDGSPPWQEISAHFYELERRSEEDELLHQIEEKTNLQKCPLDP